MNLVLHFTVCAYIAINNRRREKLPDQMINSRVIFGDMYISRVRSDNQHNSEQTVQQINYSNCSSQHEKFLAVNY